MGLDWMPGPKARAGHEREVAELQARLQRRFVFGRARKAARLQSLLVDPEETLGAPVVGRDEVATQWARTMFEQRKDVSLDMDAWLRNLDGLRVMALVAPCDGLPRYSNGGAGQYIGPDSFRAQFLVDCVPIIGQALFDSAYVDKPPAECLAYADALEEKARAFATVHGIDVGSVDAAEDPDSPEFQVDVVLAAARWCRFWARAGHGMTPWF